MTVRTSQPPFFFFLSFFFTEAVQYNAAIQSWSSCFIVERIKLAEPAYTTVTRKGPVSAGKRQRLLRNVSLSFNIWLLYGKIRNGDHLDSGDAPSSDLSLDTDRKRPVQSLALVNLCVSTSCKWSESSVARIMKTASDWLGLCNYVMQWNVKGCLLSAYT